MRRPASLRLQLLLLALVSLLPVLVLAWVLALFLLDHERERFRAAAQARNATFITALEAQVEGHLSSMRVLAASASLVRGDLQAFDADARRALATQPDWRNILLLAADGTQRMNMRFPYGQFEVRDTSAELPAIQRALQGPGPVLGPLGRGPVSGFRGVPLRFRVQPQGGEPLVLQVILRPEALEALLRRQDYPASWAFGLVDTQGEFIARVPPLQTGTRVSNDFAAAIARAPEGWFHGRTLEGRDTWTAYRTSPMTGWTVGVAMPSEELTGAAWRASSVIAGGAVLSLLVALALAGWLGGRIARPIVRLAEAARGLGRRSVAEALVDERQGRVVAEVQAVANALGDAEAALAEREQLRQREQDALRAADRAKDEFLAMLGHELRNPLSAITASAHVLRLSKPDATAAVRAHEVIDRQARQMTRLVEDLMDVSRLAMDKVTLRTERLDLAALAARVAQTWQDASRSRAGRVRATLSPAWVDGDRARLEQVLSNLLDNAHKFSGGQGPIDLRLRAAGDLAVLEVKDHGEGIAGEDLPRIFELFVQGPQSFDRPQGGIGLGLTLVRRLVELHGGTVNASSEGRGRGASFVVRLPLAQGPGEAEALLPGGAGAAGVPARRVLLVEDNEDGREAMTSLLELEGHAVRAAGNGLDAVALAASWRPDIVLVDIGLPDIDGYEVARRIRAAADGAPPRLVAVSGFGQPQDQRAAYEAGFDLHLTKPVAPEFLRDVMQALTSREVAG